jgi:serine/threonine protein kinase
LRGKTAVINVARVCERCGAKISSDATREVCPACLLESGLGLFNDESLAAIVDIDGDGGLQAPDRKKAAQLSKIRGDFGDYELLEEIGRGGQGVVYRAHQKSLNRTVALKVIGLGPWTTERHLKRFRREAEAAASLEHPAIVPIHEVGERDGQCYFSMKFVEGGQLDEVVRREPMPIRRAVELIVKVARTVHYAHEHGILHRDIKPGNILLDKNGEPHLTDFGLARLLDTQSSVTRTIDILGTPSYMAPEQAAGETTKLSKATDVYGLGAVLYQLLTGQPPFAGGTTYETIRLLRDTEPRPPRQLNPKIDRDLSTICLKCLEKDPQRRYSSALALAEDLEHWLKHEPITAKPSGLFTHSCKWVRRNPSTTVLVTLLLALAAGLSVTIWNNKPAVIIPKSVAVLPFENLSRDSDNAYLAEGIHEEILTRLASIAGLTVISRTSTQQYQSKPKNLREIAKQLGVANILEGSVQKTANQVRVNVQLVNAQTDSHLWAETYDRKLTDVFGVESEIAKRIAESLQAKLTGREEQALAVKPTNNPEAYDAYLRGLAFEARTIYQTDLRKEAIGFYERAVQPDPNFARAWARLSRAQARLYTGHEDTTPPTRRDAAKRALENAQRLEPNSPETLLALGYYQYWVLDDYRLAKTTLKEVSKLLPGNSEIPAALGHITQEEGHVDESIAYFEQGLALDPRNMDLLVGAAVTYAMRRQFPVAIKLYDRALDVIPNDPELMALKATMYQAEGNLQESAKLLIDVNERTTSGTAFEKKLNQLRLERNHAEAIRLLQARRAQVPSAFDVYDLLHLAFAQRFVGDTAGAKVTAEQARNTLEPLLKEQPDNPDLEIQLALADAVLGERNSALREAERTIMAARKPQALDDDLALASSDLVYGTGYEECLAIIETVFGENSRAISTLTGLLKATYNIYGPARVTPALLRLDPLWDPLRADPAFQKLCEEKQP